MYAECVVLIPDEPKQCWCVNDLAPPDPYTGGCHAKNHGQPQDRIKNGVLFHHHLGDILLTSDRNVTSGYLANETTSMLRLPSEASSSDLQIILPVFGSFIFVTIIVMISVIYRRRFLRKQYSTSRSMDNFVRNNDGVLLLDRMNNVSTNPTYFCANSVFLRRHNVPEVSYENLKLLEVVGEGAFGQVFRGELCTPGSESHQQVAVKVLKDRSNFEGQEDFKREVETMATFDHDNILKLLGIVVQGTEGSPYMIFEFMDHGDLSELLRQNDPVLRKPNGKVVIFNKADMVDVSVQIANGMNYLAAQRFVHRDLATRNCLVGTGLIVKIADFGMSRDIYTNDYYRIGCSRMMPVRWMSPEAIKYGRFTSESDIWAFGIVLWEIFSFGKQPYFGHTNEEVIHFLDQGILLQRPDDCPSTVYHVMLGCWKRDPRERISFDKLGKHLTDFRNRLAKQPYTHHHYHYQQQINPSIDGAALLPCLDKVDVIIDVDDKVDDEKSSGCATPPNRRDNGLDDDGYLSPVTPGSKYKPPPQFHSQNSGLNANEAQIIPRLNDGSLDATLKSSHPIKTVQLSERSVEKCQGSIGSGFHTLAPQPEVVLCSEDNAALIIKQSVSPSGNCPTKTTASFPLFKPIEVHAEQASTHTSKIVDGKLKRLASHDSQSPPSLKYSLVNFESCSPSASVTDLCPELTSLSQNTIALVHNPNYIPELSSYTNGGKLSDPGDTILPN